MDTQIANWLENYKGDFSFFVSLREQYYKRGTLSEKQQACVLKAIEKDRERAKKFSMKQGERLVLKTRAAQYIGLQLNLEHVFRNVEVVEVVDETPIGVRAKIRFLSSVASCCHICGKALDNEISKAIGIGPVCAKRIGVKRDLKVENAKEILGEIEQYVKQIGTIGPIYLPAWSYQKKEQPKLDIMSYFDDIA